MAASPLPWVTANGYMSDEYRLIVIKRALSHLSRATNDLRHFASLALDKLKVPGFRSFALANTPISRHRAIPVVTEAFQHSPTVATAIICLWAEANQQIIEELRLAAIAASDLKFAPEWTWRASRAGYLDFPKVAPLAKVAESLATDRSHPESDDLQLAVLWLSRAMIIEDATEVGTAAAESALLDSLAVISDSPVPSLPEDLRSVLQPEGQGLPLEALNVGPTVPELAKLLSDTAQETEPTEPEGDSSTMLSAIEDKTLVQLQELLVNSLDCLASMQMEALATVQALCSTTETANLVGAENLLQEVAVHMAVWRNAHDNLFGLWSILSDRLRAEREARPDLTLEQAEAGGALITQVQAARAAIGAIIAYDGRRDAVRTDLLQQIAQVRTLSDRLAEWGQAAPDELKPLRTEMELTSLTLTSIQGELGQINAECRALGESLKRLRTEAQKRSLDLVAQLRAEGEPEDSLMVEGLRLSTLSARTLSERSDAQLRLLENHLISSLEARRRAKVQPSQALATKLQEEWSSDGFSELLTSLVHEKQDEAALLLFFSGGSAHPQDPKVHLDDAMIKDLVAVTIRWSHNDQPFELFAWLAPDLLKIGAVEPGVARARLCLMLLGAQYGGKARLPAELIWEVATEWPLPSMPTWTQLWEVMASEESLPPITSSAIDDDSELPKARNRANHNLARDKGGFLRVVSLQSLRHRAMFGRDLLPPIAAFLTRLEDIETAIRQCRDEDAYKSLVLKLESLVNGELDSKLEEDEVTERYDAAITAADIDDANPFHHRTALRLLQECSESVLEYGRVLLRYAQNQVIHRADLRVEDLVSELASISDLVPLAQTVLDQIAGQPLASQERNETDSQKQVAQLVTQKMLGDGARASKMPHLVGHLIESEFRWAELVAPLLLDLTEPADPPTAVSILIEHDALNQVLLMPAGVPQEQR